MLDDATLDRVMSSLAGAKIPHRDGTYWRFSVGEVVAKLYCPRDAISESDFEHGYALKYKVIIDTNTSIMDQAMIDQIKNYVSDGGTFIQWKFWSRTQDP